MQRGGHRLRENAVGLTGLMPESVPLISATPPRCRSPTWASLSSTLTPLRSARAAIAGDGGPARQLKSWPRVGQTMIPAAAIAAASSGGVCMPVLTEPAAVLDAVYSRSDALFYPPP